MAVNWGTRLSGGSLAWGLRVANAIGPVAGVLRVVGQAPTLTTDTGQIDGGGEIGAVAERTFTAFYFLGGEVEQSFTALYQIPAISLTAGSGTLRLIGQAPTTAITLNVVRAPLVGSLRLVGQVPATATTGDLTAAPVSGTLRLVGGIPSLDPKVVNPSAGTLRLIGQAPPPPDPKVAAPSRGLLRIIGQAPTTDIGHKFAAPIAGVLRIVCQGEAERTFTAIWQRAETEQAAFTAVWQVYTAVGVLALNVRQPSPGLTTGQNTIRVADRQRQISLARAA